MKQRWFFVGILAMAVLVGLQGASVLAQGSGGPGPIVYASDRSGNFEIYVLDPDTGLTTQLTNGPAADVEPVWSPEGDLVAFSSDRDGDFEIYIVRADGSDLRQLTMNTAEDRLPRWQPGGEYVIYSSDVNGQWDLYAVSADGALVRQLTNDPSDERGPGFGAGGQVGPVVSTLPAVTPTPSGPDGVIDNTSQLNVRVNPGTGAEVITFLTRNTPVDIVGRYADNSWLQILLPDGRMGWVSGAYVRVNIDLNTVPVVNVPFIAPPPTSTPTPTVQPTPSVIIEFWADRTTINTGQCVTISWRVEGIKEVYYKDKGVVGAGSSQECPTQTTTYNLRIILRDDTVDNRYITIVVNP